MSTLDADTANRFSGDIRIAQDTILQGISPGRASGIAIAWTEFFGDKLGATMEKWTDRLLKNADAYRTRLVKSLSEAPDVSSALVESLDRIIETTEKVLRELLAQANAKMGGDPFAM